MEDEHGRSLVGYMDPNKKYVIGEKYQYYGKKDYYEKHPVLHYFGMDLHPDDPNPDQNNEKAVMHDVIFQEIFLFFSEGFGEIFGGGAEGASLLARELNPNEIEELAQEIVEFNKTTEGMGNLLSGTPASALNTAMYYTVPSEQAASVFRTIIQNHMFSDGCKRTAVAAIELMAKRMNLKLVSSNDLLNLSVKVATHSLDDIEQLAKLIIKH